MKSVLNESKTVLHPCSIESFSQNCGYFACGMYELIDQAEQNRIGEIECYKVTTNRPIQSISSVKFDSGVLDMKICCGDPDLLAVALSNSKLNIYSWVFENDEPNLKILTSISDINGSEGLFLSVAWSESNYLNSQSLKLAISTQSGSILIYDYNQESISQSLIFSSVHTMFNEAMPAWIVTFDIHSTGNRFLSGGDDCTMKIWDLRINNNKPIHNDSKTHQAGVTTAQWHPELEHIFVTGSYDEYIRIWDDRQLKKPIIEEHTGKYSALVLNSFLIHFTLAGGVWRTKWKTMKSNNRSYLAVSCMQGGSAIYDVNNLIDSKITWQQLYHHIDDSSNHLAYGIDFLNDDDHENEMKSKLVVVSCSFYDNSLSVWEGEIDSE